MTGLFSGLKVLDFTTGIAGPISTMMLADRGAEVTRIEAIRPHPFPALDQDRVWNRGKRSALFDLDSTEDRALLRTLAARADVVVESFAPGRAAELGIDYQTLRADNPRLVHCSITPYGRSARHAGRPDYDQLVAARAGLQWEARGWYGSPMDHVKGRDREAVDQGVPEAIRMGSDRDGPIFTATPAPSIVCAYDALLGISAALRARELTGRGQWVETSLLQAIIMMNCSGWQRPTNDDVPGYQYDVLDRRQTYGIVDASDGFMCIWVTPPQWFASAGAGDTLVQPQDDSANMRKYAMMPIGTRLEVLASTAPILRKFTVEQWVRAAAENGNVSCQPVQTPEQALCDPALLAEGSVVEVEDAELGVLRQVGAAYRLSERPITVRSGAPRRGEHTDAVKVEAKAPAVAAPAGAAGRGKTLKGPLAGVRVIDFGAAVAGPWATQLLADMGADVIKVDPPHQAFWMVNHMAMAVNRSKRWIGIDAKTGAGAEIARRLVRDADVVMHNMRPQAARKLGFDFESLSELNPRLIYCTTRGFEDGPRSFLPGNDQTANALGGTEWEDGGCWDGGRPWFGTTSNGDLGNGFLAAIGVTQALYDRERTGRGQVVDASILNAALVNNSRVYTDLSGTNFDRPKLDGDQTGFSALYRLYRCADDAWLCIGIFSEEEWQAFVRAVPALAGDARFVTAALRAEQDATLTALLREIFASEAAAIWFDRLDAAGAPCEIASDSFSKTMFDDPELIERKWVVRGEGNPHTGPIDMFGLPIDFSDTPATPGGAPPVLWQHSREILREIGYSDDEIDLLARDKAVVLPESDRAR